MSHYGRISEADKLDRYYTPRWPIELLLERLDQVDAWGAGQTVAEPCAGEGAMVEVLEGRGHDVIAGDIDPVSPFPECDATSPEALERYRDVDWVITNPPYSADTGSATDVIRQMLALEVPMAFLLRLSWAEPCALRKLLFRGTFDAGPGEEMFPDAPDEIIVLPRVHYWRPGYQSEKRNPQTSMWVLWLGLAGLPTVRWATPEDRKRVEGQQTIT